MLDPDDIDAIFGALQTAAVRYLVVGIIHHDTRSTSEIDLIVDYEAANVGTVLTVLGRLGYRPAPPVEGMDLADPAVRRTCSEDRRLVMFPLTSAARPKTEIAIFVREPVPFDVAYARASRSELGACTVTVADSEDLIAIYGETGRATP